VIIDVGALPPGQLRRTTSRLPPIPPPATTRACAEKLNWPTFVVEVGTPRGSSVGSSTEPDTRTPEPSISIEVTRCRARIRTRRECSTRSANGSTSAGPVPQTRWKRGTELPCPGAV
jgi:hypothetical protein